MRMEGRITESSSLSFSLYVAPTRLIRGKLSESRKGFLSGYTFLFLPLLVLLQS